jgi:ribonuclease HI
MPEKNKKKRWYAYRLPSGESGVVADWRSCEEKVSGVAVARYRGFSSESEARAWLVAGAAYDIRPRAELEPGIYFDAGTGRGNGVEVRVTDEHGRDLLFEIYKKKELSEFGTYRIAQRGVTNNYGELLALRAAIMIARKHKKKKIFGDSKLVIDHWSRGAAKRKDLPSETVRLIYEVVALRTAFESSGGSIARISGDDNPADLGFHR